MAKVMKDNHLFLWPLPLHQLDGHTKKGLNLTPIRWPHEKSAKKYVSYLDAENTQTALFDWQDEKANNQALISLLCLEVERP